MEFPNHFLNAFGKKIFFFIGFMFFYGNFVTAAEIILCYTAGTGSNENRWVIANNPAGGCDKFQPATGVRCIDIVEAAPQSEVVTAYENLHPLFEGSAIIGQVTTTLLSGEKDNFVLPSDNASPSAAMQAAGGTFADYDSTAVNAQRGHSFTALPKASSASLKIHLEAIGDVFSNDDIRLDIDNGSGPNLEDRWISPISDLVPSWPGTHEIDLPLLSLPPGTGINNLIQGINTFGFIDIRVSDDTNVDYYELALSTMDFVATSKRSPFAVRYSNGAHEIATLPSVTTSQQDIVLVGVVAQNEVIEYPQVPELAGLDGGVFTADEFGVWYLSLDVNTLAIKDLTVVGFNTSSLSFSSLPPSDSVPFLPNWALLVLVAFLAQVAIVTNQRD